MNTEQFSQALKDWHAQDPANRSAILLLAETDGQGGLHSHLHAAYRLGPMTAAIAEIARRNAGVADALRIGLRMAEEDEETATETDTPDADPQP